MSPTETIPNVVIRSVGMAQIDSARAPDRLSAIVGSSVAIAMYEPDSGFGMLAHAMLPDSKGCPVQPGKYVDTAIRWMIEELLKEGAKREELVAKVAGAATLFGPLGSMDSGDPTGNAALDTLRREGITTAGSCLGGKRGRRVCFEPATCEMTVDDASTGIQII